MKLILLILSLGLFSLITNAADTPEEGFWKSVTRSDLVEEYRLYVEQYPKGKYLGKAWRRIGQLETEQKSALAGRRVENELRPGKIFKDCTECPEMVVIPPGSFEMGGTDSDEKPVHGVTLKSFAMGKTEVTQGQWKAIMGSNPSHFSSCGDTCPVEKVNWSDAKEFISKLNAKTGKQYRLPSEAEWEYACRAGGRDEYCGSGNVDSVAWYGSNSGSKTHPAAGKQANAWGLYDMSGNVWEWTEDCWNGSYNGAPTDGSAWTNGDCSKRVARGGSWGDSPAGVRAAYRNGDGTSVRNSYEGFRLARMLP